MSAKAPTIAPSVTVEDVLAWKPCYSDASVCELLDGRERWTALDLLGLDIPIEDRFWVVLRPELIDVRTLRLWACWCARYTPLADGRTAWDLLTDGRSRAALEVAERFARGEASEEELAAARDASRAAAEAAGAAAWDAAEAAGAAAWAAAWYAAWDAAEAARAAAEAARAAQANELRRMLRETYS